jgi:hypothetical protein
VEDGVHAFAGGGYSGGIREVGLDDLYAVGFKLWLGGAAQRGDGVPSGYESIDDVLTHESTSACDKYVHCVAKIV